MSRKSHFLKQCYNRNEWLQVFRAMEKKVGGKLVTKQSMPANKSNMNNLPFHLSVSEKKTTITFHSEQEHLLYVFVQRLILSTFARNTISTQTILFLRIYFPFIQLKYYSSVQPNSKRCSHIFRILFSLETDFVFWRKKNFPLVPHTFNISFSN